MARPEQFVQTFVEKLLAYSLGRSTEWYDMPAVREMVRESAADDYSFFCDRDGHRPERAVHDARCRRRRGCRAVGSTDEEEAQ